MLKNIRPLIEKYQTINKNDFYGNKLPLGNSNLTITYSISSDIIHANDISPTVLGSFTPKKLKHDMKVLFISLYGKKIYKKISKVVKNDDSYNSLIDSDAFISSLLKSSNKIED